MEKTGDRENSVRALVSMSHTLYKRGWLEGTSGNLSVLDEQDGAVALVTASGRPKGELAPADIVPVKVATAIPLLSEGPRPSAETSIHVALYRTVPDCRAVIHAHAPYATAVASLAVEHKQNSVQIADYELLKGFGLADPSAVTVPVFPNWRDVRKIGSDVETHYSSATGERPPFLLIGHHGATVWGPTLEAAHNRLECLESICQLMLLTGQSRSVTH